MWDESCLITKNEDVYYKINNLEIIKYVNYITTFEIYETKKANIIIDSELKNEIISLFMNYGDTFYVYDIHKGKILTPIESFDLDPLFVYSTTFDKYVSLYLMINYYINFPITWEKTKALNIVKKYNTFVDILRNYIGITEYKNVTKTQFNTYVNEIFKIVDANYKISKTTKINDKNVLGMCLNELYNKGVDVFYFD